MPIFLPALAGLAGYLMSNPRRRKHRRRRNPATAKDVRRLQLLENEYIVAKNRYENRRPRDDAAKLKREMTEARIRHRFFWGHAADEPRGYVFRARRNPKRRAKKVKVRRKVKGKWRTVTTITKTVRRVKTNPQAFWWYRQVRDERNRPWYRERNDNHAVLSATKPHPDTAGRRWRRDKRTERQLGLPDMNALRSNPAKSLRDASRLIDNNHYYVSDKEAGALTRQYGKGTLPGTGYDQILHTPEGKFWLSRTEVRYHARFKKKRGWVWCVYPTASNPRRHR